MPSCARLTALLAASCLSTAVSAAEPDDPASCTAIPDRLERLACYDRLHGVDAPEVAGAQPEPAEPAPPAAEAATELGAEQLPAARSDTAAEVDELIATVAGMGEQATGRHWFRLENGQLWSQVSPGRAPVGVGDSVRISRGALNTYSLRRADGGSRSTAVRRLE